MTAANNLLKQLVRDRVRAIHNKNVAISATDKTVDPALAMQFGFRAPLPGTAPDVDRRMRRKLERRMMKKLVMKGLHA